MRQSSIFVLVGALAASAPGCHRRGDDAPQAAGLASAAAGDDGGHAPRPPNPFVPDVDPLELPEPSPVHVPSDGDVTAALTEQTSVRVPGGSPAPAKAAPAPLPKTHAGDARAWECLGHDECYFPRMPFYNQGNPNFAHVEVPRAIYDAEAKKVTGPMEWDEAANHWAVVLKPRTARTLDPYYNSWLPFGPISKQDDGSIGYWFTAICGPTAEAMALMAALAARSPSTRLKPGSWTERAFLHARRPNAQAPLPEPLLQDHSSLAPDHRQMTADDLQRVVNMAVRQRTNPMAGGGDGVILHLADDFEPVGGKSPVQTRSGGRVTSEVIMDAIRDRFATVIVVGGWKASLTPVHEENRLVKYTLRFKRVMGHVLAVNGFSVGADHEPSLLIYNPVYAAPTRKSVLQVPVKGATRDGVPIEVVTPNGADHLAILHEDSAPSARPPPASVAEITDGQEVFMFDGYSALKIE